MLRDWWSRLRADDVNELDDEVRFHIEMETERNVRRGMNPMRARRQALRSFGSVDRVKEEVLDEYPARVFSDFGQDIRYGIRSLVKTPASSATALVALMLGIGLTTLMFSIVYGVILRGPPFERAERLVFVARTHPGMHPEEFSATAHDYEHWRQQQRSFSDLAALRLEAVNLRVAAQPDRYEGAYVTHTLFRTLRVEPALGRSFGAADDRPGAPAVILIGSALWQNRFGGDPKVLGSVVRANGEDATIIGVMPERFGFPSKQQVWLPLRLDRVREERGAEPDLHIIGRLADGVTMEMAGLEMNQISQSLERAYPDTNADVGARVSPLMEFLLTRRVIPMLYTMFGSVLMVLLIACTNVANIIISRNAIRAKEIGVRAALGASKLRIVRQFLTESLLLSCAGALLGVVLAWGGIRAFNASIAGTGPPFWIDIRLHPGVLVFALGAAIAAAVLAGAIPAWQAARADVKEVLEDEARGSSSFRLGRLSRGLVGLEIALSVGLLVGAGLMVRSVINLRTVDVGFATRDVFTGEVTLTERDYSDPASRQRLFELLLPRLEAVPGIESVALSTALPGIGSGRVGYDVSGQVHDDKRKYPEASFGMVSADFFTAFGVRPLAGRVFGSMDRPASAPVALISTALARKEFPAGDAIGKQLRLARDSTPRTIVGVVPDLYMAGIRESDQPALFLPLSQGDARRFHIAARVKGEPLAATPAIRAAVASLDPDLPVYFVSSMQGVIDDRNWFYVVFGGLFMTFGGSALVLAAIGLYGVMATAVRHRTREMGVRLALGAAPAAVVRLILREGMVQLAFGLAAGLTLGFFVSRLLSILLFNVPPNDAFTFGIIIAVMMTTALAASLLPALRAARVSPIEALRHD